MDSNTITEISSTFDLSLLLLIITEIRVVPCLFKVLSVSNFNSQCAYCAFVVSLQCTLRHIICKAADNTLTPFFHTKPSTTLLLSLALVIHRNICPFLCNIFLIPSASSSVNGSPSSISHVA